MSGTNDNEAYMWILFLNIPWSFLIILHFLTISHMYIIHTDHSYSHLSHIPLYIPYISHNSSFQIFFHIYVKSFDVVAH